MTYPATIDKYQIVSHLGSGSFGAVYRVRDRALGAEKAIKVLDVSDPTQFLTTLEEAQILNKCRHKHIVTINEANVFKVLVPLVSLFALYPVRRFSHKSRL